jgi:hypothetical protein
MPDRWDDLGDDELRERLIQRGVQRFVAEQLVARRDDPSAEKRITRELSR